MINPTTPSTTETVSVNTSTDIPADTSAAYTVVAGGQVSETTITDSSPTAAAGARSVYTVKFTTSSHGGLSRGRQHDHGHVPGEHRHDRWSGTSVADTTVSNSAWAPAPNGRDGTCTLFSSASIPAGHRSASRSTA